MVIRDLLKTAKTFVEANDAVLLTGVGVTGVVTTSVLTHKAAIKADRALRYDRERRSAACHTSDGYIDPVWATKKDKLKLVWPIYIPAVGMGSTTIAAIIMANHVSSKRAAALAAAYGISERAFTEYKEKVAEKLGENKEMAIRDEIAQDRVDAKPVTVSTVIIGNGEVLCLENWGGRYFKSSVQQIEKARNDLNHRMMSHSYASLSEFFDEIGLPPTGGSDEVGWNINSPLEINISTALSTDDTPCLVLDFQVAPVAGYGNLY